MFLRDNEPIDSIVLCLSKLKVANFVPPKTKKKGALVFNTLQSQRLPSKNFSLIMRTLSLSEEYFSNFKITEFLTHLAHSHLQASLRFKPFTPTSNKLMVIETPHPLDLTYFIQTFYLGLCVTIS